MASKQVKRNWRVRDKSLQLRVDAGTDINGKRITHTRTVSDYNPDTGRRLTDAQRNRLWDDFAAEVRQGRIEKPSTLTIKDLAEFHLRISTDLSPETKKGYMSIIKHHLSGDFGTRKANRVTTAQINQWIHYLASDYRSPKGKQLTAKRIRNIIGLVSAAYNTAITNELVSKNPCTNAKLPSVQKKDASYLEYEDALRLISALRDVPEQYQSEKVAVLLGIMCGLRRGEICGLDESDLDLEKRTLRVRQARYELPGGGTYIKPPKSRTSIRTIALPDPLVSEMVKMLEGQAKSREALGTKWKSEGSLLKNADGSPILPKHLYAWLNRFLDANGLPHIGVHGLRHSYASTLVHLAVDLKTISSSLGHADITITDRYIHQFKDKDRQIADAIAGLYDKNVDKMRTDIKNDR